MPNSAYFFKLITKITPKIKAEFNTVSLKFTALSIITIFITEFLIMLMLAAFPIHNTLLETLIDSSVLAFVLCPFIYFYIVKKILLKNNDLFIQLLKQKEALDSSTLISESDLNGKITYVNQQFCRTSGYRENELLGKGHNILSSGVHSKEFWKEFWTILNAGNTWRGEVCNKAKDQSLYWSEMAVIPNKDADKKIIGYSAIRVDITAKKNTQIALINQEKLASIGEIAAGVGHEINNPLAIIVGNHNIIKTTLKSNNIENERILKALEKIDIASNRIKKIVDGLRTYSRTDSDDTQIISLAEVINQTIYLVEEIYSKDGIKVTLNLDTSPMSIVGNIGKLQQIIMNLVSNAKDATEGKRERNIIIKAENIQNKNVVLSVADNGSGIPKNIIDKIFNPFFTTKEVGKGTGIGLRLVDEFVKKMDGKIEVVSKPEEGTCFILTFPFAFKDPSVQSGAVITSEQSVAQLSGNILIVDDEPDILEILSEYLNDLGLTVDTANDGTSALKLLENKKFNYICTDLMMPAMNGNEFIKIAKKHPNGINAKFYIISGGVTSNQNNDKSLPLDNLADGFIQKPFTQESIYNVLIKQ
jgi:PAS domain S-box-containing protein